MTPSAPIPPVPADTRPLPSLDELLPVFDVRERHRRVIPSEPERMWQALASVSMNDLAVTRALMAVRSLGRTTALQDIRLVDGGPLQVVAADPPRGMVAAAIGRPWRPLPVKMQLSSPEEFREFDGPGWTKYLTDFRLTPVPSGTAISTETRCLSTSRRAKLAFGVYWLLIRPFSGLVRREMLAAVDRMAVS